MKMQRILISIALTALILPLQGQTLTSRVQDYKGSPALYVNGKLTSALLGYAEPKDVPDLLKAGINIIDFGVSFGWVGPEKYDFSHADRVMDEFLQIDPGLLALPRFSIVPGRWWCREFPDEITRREDGQPAGFGAPCYPSFASKKYRDLSKRALKAFVTHMESRYGSRIVGYFPGNGIYGEWLSWHSYWEIKPGEPVPKTFGVEDYSAPAQSAFQAWLRTKYGNSPKKLRKAWGNPDLTFETASIPSEKVRTNPTHGLFFDPAVGLQAPDHYEFFNDLVSDVLLEQARGTKEACNRQKVVGVFYGYLWCNYPHLSQNRAGHLGFWKVLQSPEVDFISSPYMYDNRALGGANASQSLPETVALHGKLYINEADTETHLQQRQWRWGNSLRNPTSFPETKGLLVRDYGYALSKGFGMWYMDLLGGMFHDPEIIALLSDVRRIEEKNLEVEKISNAEIAVVLDDESYRYFGDGEILFTALLNAQRQWELNYLGAPYDVHLLRDMANPRLRSYKLYIFLNTFRFSPSQRDAVHRKLSRDRATALWVYAPGYIGDSGLSVEYMRELTGIRIAEYGEPGELRVQITSKEHPYTRSLAANFEYGTDVNVAGIKATFDHRLYLKDPSDPGLQRDLPGFRITPRFYGNDPKAIVLGRLSGVDQPGLLVKAQPGWNSIYSAAPVIRTELLREIARAAGCHIYQEDSSVVYASRNFLSVYATRAGEKTIRLPEPARVLDLLENKIVSSGQKEFKIRMNANSCVLFRLER